MMPMSRWIAWGAAAAALASPASALDVSQRRGDFYFDSRGAWTGLRSVDFPAATKRRPMSFREKFATLGLALPEREGPLQPRYVAPKPAHVAVYDKLRRDEVMVKFVEGTPVRLRGGQLTSARADLSQVTAILRRYPEAKLHRAFESLEERILDEDKETGEILGGKQLADLNNWYLLVFDKPGSSAVDLASDLLALDLVETAYLPADPELAFCTDVGGATPNYEPFQDYLGPAPDGVDARYAWAYDAGGNGFGPSFQIVDVEFDWCTTHEDLAFDASDVLNGLSGPTGTDDTNHGTAVLGEFGACDNGYGVTGICSDVALRGCDLSSNLRPSETVAAAASFMTPGEIMVIEIHIGGPSTGLPCPCNCSQFERVPLEFDQASFDAIQTATANGIIVAELAGNGSVSLDNPVYGGLFNRNVRDSGAILTGAAWPISHDPTCFTNYGSRVDLHGYGENVTTTGYGSIFGNDCTEEYTSGFNGTSSANPMIAGACGCLQGIAKRLFGLTMSPGAVRNLLTWTGTPQGASSEHIGPMPDLRAAVDHMIPIGPDLTTSYTPPGWTLPLVPRTTSDATNGSAPLQAAALPGTPSLTYLNLAVANYSVYSPTVHQPSTYVLVDDATLFTGPDGDVRPSSWISTLNLGSGIKAGRHTLLARADYLGVEQEYDETNNDWVRQFIWAPNALNFDVPHGDTAGPPATSPGWGPFYNCEGYSGSMGANWWYAFAVLPRPEGGPTEFDMLTFTTPPSNIPQAGFDVPTAWSGEPAGAIDFVVLDRNVLPWGTYYGGVLNFWGNAQKVVEFDMDHGTVPNPGITGPYTLADADLVELHEIFLYVGVPVQISVQPTSGSADIGLSVYKPPNGFATKQETVPGGIANAAGGGAGESVLIVPASNGYYGIVVWKVGSTEVTNTLTYNLVVSAPSPNLASATPSGWYGPVVPRNTTDAASNNCPLPPTLAGNATTTSFNFSTYNAGLGAAVAPWSTAVYVDNEGRWLGPENTTVPGLTFALWNNTPQGSPLSLVRGGRHHVEALSDVFSQVAESYETDNLFTDWFVWTPLDLADQVPVLRAAPPTRHPYGWGPYESCDGFRIPGFQGSYWTAVGMIPADTTADYDVRLHTASTGSRDGFGDWLIWSWDPFPGNPDFCIVNYNVAPGIPYDVSVTNSNGSNAGFYVQRADAPYYGLVPAGVSRYGPMTLDAHDCLNIHEFYFQAGVPTYISVDNESGNVDLEAFLFDGTVPYHMKGTYMTYDNASGPGGDEHLGPVTFATSGYYAVVVAKSKAFDVDNAATYELVMSTVGNPVDAPVVEAPPVEFGLSMPRPNPSSAGMSVELAVPAGRGKATVAVYDLAGRRVRSLVDGEVATGRRVLTWDGRDASGRAVSAGVYFVKLEAPHVKETKKITLLR